VIPDHQVYLVAAQQPNRTSALDTLFGATFVAISFSAILNVTHQIDDFAGQ